MKEQIILIVDFMGTILKFNALTSKLDLVQNPEEIGSSSTYIKVDITNHKIQLYINGVLKAEWT